MGDGRNAVSRTTQRGGADKGKSRRFKRLTARGLGAASISAIRNKSTVLVLNRNWQAIHVKTPAQAFCMMATDVATALDIEHGGDMRPVKWMDWLSLPVREGDNAVRTVHGAVRVPTVIVLATYAKVPT